jgi:hypothetical protein
MVLPAIGRVRELTEGEAYERAVLAARAEMELTLTPAAGDE